MGNIMFEKKNQLAGFQCLNYRVMGKLCNRSSVKRQDFLESPDFLLPHRIDIQKGRKQQEGEKYSH